MLVSLVIMINDKTFQHSLSPNTCVKMICEVEFFSSHTFLTTDQCWYWKLSERRGTLGKSMENIWSWQLEKMHCPLYMKISWLWQLEKLHCPLCMKYLAIAMEKRHCRKNVMLKGHCRKNVMLSQQGVRFVISSRGKNAKSSYLSFCLSSENYLLYLCLHL